MGRESVFADLLLVLGVESELRGEARETGLVWELYAETFQPGLRDLDVDGSHFRKDYGAF